MKFGAFSQNIKTVSTGGIEEKPASPVNPSCLQVSPFLIILFSGLRKQGHQDIRTRKMQELKVSIKASKSWRKLIKRIGGISSLRKRLNENLRQIHYKSGRECGEALDPVLKRNLAYRLENIVLVEDNSSRYLGKVRL